MLEDDVVAGHPAEALPPLGEWCQSIIDALPAAFCVCDTRGLVVACNGAAVALWGTPLPTGVPVESLFRQMRKNGTGNAATASPASFFEAVLRGGEPVCGVDVVIDTAQADPLNALVGLRPLRDGNGEVRGVLVEIQPVEPQDDLEDMFEHGSLGLHSWRPTARYCVRTRPSWTCSDTGVTSTSVGI